MRQIGRLLLLWALVLALPYAAWGQNYPGMDTDRFVTRWKAAAGEKIVIPLSGSYNYRIVDLDDYGRPVDDTYITGNRDGWLTINCSYACVFRLEIKFSYSGMIQFGKNQYGDETNGTPEALLLIERWGSAPWSTMEWAFKGCKNMNISPDAGNPDLSRVKKMSSMFDGCMSLNQSLGGWDVSKVLVMDWMFRGCTSFNQSLGSWTFESIMYQFDFFHTALDVDNYSNTLEAWARKKNRLPSSLTVNANGMKYNAKGRAAREELKSHGWTFNGDVSDGAPVSPERVVIENAPQTMVVGGMHTFNARVEPAAAPQDVRWSVIAGKDIASFTGNVLRVSDEGTVTVREETVAEPIRSDQVLVEVKAAVRKPESVSIVNAPSSLVVGRKYKFSAEVLPQDAPQGVRWSVDGDGASFSGNELSVEEKGWITVRVKTEATPTQEDELRLEVKAEEGGDDQGNSTKLTRITLEPNRLELNRGEERQLTVNYTPSNASNRTVTWKTSDRDVARVIGGTVIAIKKGRATITATSSEGGLTATCDVEVKEDNNDDDNDNDTAVGSLALRGVSVSPNPFGRVLTVQHAEGVLSYELVNGVGVVVLNGRHDGMAELRLMADGLADGVYWLRLHAADGVRVLGVVKR